MRQEKRTPRLGMILVLCAAVAAIWMTAVYGTYKETQYTKYDVRVSPGSVNYGTHSTATMPMVAAPSHHMSTPMISGGEVRSYAYSGHASYAHNPSPATPIYTTSSATIHTIGSGGGNGGGVSSSPSGDRGASSRGMSYSGGSVAMPALAVNCSLLATSSVSAAEASVPRAGGPRKIKENGDGEYQGESNGSGKYWDEEEGWVDLFVGAIKIEGGKVYQCTSVSPIVWTYMRDQEDPSNPTPLGNTPWLWMLLLVLGYGVFKARKRSWL